jgi:hypothetical protein
MKNLIPVNRTLKTNQTIICNSIEHARTEQNLYSNAQIVCKNDNYSVVNYKTSSQLITMGYVVVR